jgi:hypothetical protein
MLGLLILAIILLIAILIIVAISLSFQTNLPLGTSPINPQMKELTNVTSRLKNSNITDPNAVGNVLADASRRGAVYNILDDQGRLVASSNGKQIRNTKGTMTSTASETDSSGKSFTVVGSWPDACPYNPFLCNG